MNHLNREHHNNQQRNAAAILEVKDLSVSFDKQEVLENISFSVNEGDVLAIIGPNGAGKTVLFRALMELIPFDGEVKWREDARIGYVPQKLFEKAELPLTVKEFFILKSKNLFFKDAQLIESIPHELESVGLKPDILDQQLANLSRGQFQRVLIAWAILKHPNVLLFDEPTAGIDLAGEDTVYNLLYKLKKERGMTIIIISHDLNIIYRYADNVLCINKNQLCFGEPKQALTGEQIERLYGESAFHHHQHHHH
ncbi:metal ABC transporter ATP-binding protein [Candidatus Wolfebacteria bacterium]|nr:metal ABC transporter ATP-binding protein [Candidatus Wolfebacteria bacterium]